VSLLGRKLWRDLRRHGAQTAAIMVTVVIGVALFGATSDAYRNLDDSYRALYEDLRFADLTVTGGPVQAIARQATAAGGLASIRTVADVPLEVHGSKLIGRVVGMPTDGQPAVDRVLLLSGSPLTSGATTGVLAEQHMASSFDLGEGDAVRILGPDGWIDADVRGVAASPEYLWPARSRQEILVPPGSFGVLFVPEALANRLAPVGTPKEVAVYGVDAAIVDQLARSATAGGALATVTRDEQPSNAALQEDVSGFGELAVLFPILFLAAAAMAAFVLLGRLVRTQRGEIGMLSANGVARGTIFRAYLRYGVLVGLVGGALGAALGLALGAWITRLYTAAISVPVTVIRVSWVTPVLGVAIAVIVCSIAAAGPARAAAAIAPAEAMRGDIPAGMGGAGRLARLTRMLPGRWKLAIRDIGRSRRRTLSTVLGVVLSLVLVLVSWGMLDTTQILLAKQFDTVQRQDAQVTFTSGGASEAALAALMDVPGVAAVEPAAQLDVSITRDDRSYATTLLGLPPATTMHTFASPDGSVEQLSGSGLIVGSALADQVGASIGDVVTVRSPRLARPVELPIAGTVDEPLGTFAYVSLPALEVAAGTGSLADTALLRFMPGVDRAQVLARLADRSDVAAAVDALGLKSAADSLMRLFYVFVGVMLAFGALMSFALMFNTMSANVSERSVEMATLRAAGVGRRTISGILTRENLIMTLIGVPIGLVIGYVVAAGFMSSFSSDLFSFSLHIRWSTLALSAAAMVGVALLSQWPALRTVGRLDVARVVRERSI
jgi:putative ABC transport system permease protein